MYGSGCVGVPGGLGNPELTFANQNKITILPYDPAAERGGGSLDFFWVGVSHWHIT